MTAKRLDAAARLAALAGNAPRRAPNVRSLARFAANSECRLASVGFAAQVDFDHLLTGTRYEVPFGQSPFAFRRGDLFEEILRKDGHAPLRGLLADKLGGNPATARVANLREGFAKNRKGMADRAERTREIMAAILRGDRAAPNLIDGAVLTREVGGIRAYFEADAVAAHFAEPIFAGEIKSFPTIDGQADPEKVGAAVSQVSIYILLLRELVEGLKGKPERVSSKALLITPLNTGLRPTVAEKEVGREVDRADRILKQAPSAPELAANLAGNLPSFDRVSEQKLDATERVETAERLAEAVGTHYAPSCLSTCGMSRLCRERAHRAGDPARIGGQLVRLLPSVRSLDRVVELVDGATASPAEAAVADELTRAATLLRAVTPAASPRSRSSRGSRRSR